MRAALIARGLDDAAARVLEYELCTAARDRPRAPAPVPPPCAEMLVLQALARGGGLTAVERAEIHGVVNATCATGTPPTSSFRWTNGQLAHASEHSWYWPDGRLARNGVYSWYWPNGRLARNGEHSWYWPDGRLAENGAGSFFSPEGRSIDEASLLQRVCVDVDDCRFVQGPPADARRAWMLSLSSTVGDQSMPPSSGGAPAR